MQILELENYSIFPFLCAGDKLLYLGVYFLPSVENIYRANFKLFISKVKTEAQIWDKIYKDWLWKQKSVKIVAKKFLFDAYCNPVCNFKEINCIYIKFLWASNA